MIESAAADDAVAAKAEASEAVTRMTVRISVTIVPKIRSSLGSSRECSPLRLTTLYLSEQ